MTDDSRNSKEMGAKGPELENIIPVFHYSNMAYFHP